MQLLAGHLNRDTCHTVSFSHLSCILSHLNCIFCLHSPSFLLPLFPNLEKLPNSNTTPDGGDNTRHPKTVTTREHDTARMNRIHAPKHDTARMKRIHAPNVGLQALACHLHGEAYHVGRQHWTSWDLVHPHRQDLDCIGTSTTQVHAQIIC